MNLAFIAKRYALIGGTERDLFELTTRLAQRGHQVTVYAAQIRTEAAPGVRLVRIPSRLPGRTALFNSIAYTGPAMARAGGHDLVYAFARTVDQDVVRCGGGMHASFLTATGDDAGPAVRFLRTLSPYHRANLSVELTQFQEGHFKEITAISRVVKREILATTQVREEQVRIIYDGIDTQRFHPDRTMLQGKRMREELRIPADTRLLLFVGTGFRRKGLHLLLKALPLIRDKSHVLLVVGEDHQAPAFTAMAKTIARGHDVRFLGRRQDVEAFYAASDLLILPTLHEAFGNVVLEALASGIPAAVSACAGAAEVLEGTPLAPGIIPDPRQPQSIADAINHLLPQTGQLREPALNLASRFTFDQNANEIEAQCQRLIELAQMA